VGVEKGTWRLVVPVAGNLELTEARRAWPQKQQRGINKPQPCEEKISMIRKMMMSMMMSIIIGCSSSSPYLPLGS